MSQLVARILLSIFVFPLGGLCYTVAFVLLDDSSLFRSLGYEYRETIAFLGAGLATWAAVATYWALLWRSAVSWTGRRVGRTTASAAAAAAAGLLAGLAVYLPSRNHNFAAFVGSVSAVLLWLIATVFLWRETADERARRVAAGNAGTIACPTCGYNLTGLTEARCPECGGRFTLDQLLAGQPGHGDEALAP